MFGATFLVALSYMIHARLEARFDTIPARVLVMTLAFAQPLVRGWARYSTWLRFKRTPGSVIMAPHAHENSALRWLQMKRRRYWNEEGIGREALITEIVRVLEDRKLAVFDRHGLGSRGTSRSTATCGGTCACAPSPSTTAARGA